jgi:hypothetical protein
LSQDNREKCTDVGHRGRTMKKKKKMRREKNEEGKKWRKMLWEGKDGQGHIK